MFRRIFRFIRKSNISVNNSNNSFIGNSIKNSNIAIGPSPDEILNTKKFREIEKDINENREKSRSIKFDIEDYRDRTDIEDGSFRFVSSHGTPLGLCRLKYSYALCQVSLGNALVGRTMLADCPETQKMDDLIEARESYKIAIDIWESDPAPDLMLEHDLEQSLPMAYYFLATACAAAAWIDKSRTDRLEESVHAYQKVIDKISARRNFNLWRGAMFSMALSIDFLAQAEKSSEKFEEAVDIYENLKSASDSRADADFRDTLSDNIDRCKKAILYLRSNS